jgi:hypothetical protein
LTAAGWLLPAPGDIVWCRFPELPRRSPGPKPRPALVSTVTERTDGVAVAVVYSTSQQLDRLSAGQFAITRRDHAAAFRAAGLSHDTKFDFKQAVELPWNLEFFAVPPGAPFGQQPKLGVLHASVYRAAAVAYPAAKAR